MPVKIFFCYAHADEDLLMKLKRHLSPLVNQGLIDVWHDRNISAGTEWEQEIKEQLNSAQIILLLVSPDFMASNYINDVELKRAIERHQRGEGRVIPIILRPVYWQGILGHLQALPKDGLPVTDPEWHTLDRALYNVTEGIRKVVEQWSQRHVPPPEVPPPEKIDFNGFGTKVQPVSLRTGSYKFIGSHDGVGQFAVWVRDKQNTPYQEDAVIFTSNKVKDEEGAIYIKDDDSYILKILAHGEWKLSIQKIF